MPDLSRSVTRQVAVVSTAARRTGVLRAGLMVAAAFIAWQAVPQMVGEQRLPGASGAAFHAPASHHTRHAVLFGVALAVGLLVVAVRPARARTMLPVALMAAAALVVTALLDWSEGRITIFSERQHLPELIVLVLVWLLAPTPPVGRPIGPRGRVATSGWSTTTRPRRPPDEGPSWHRRRRLDHDVRR